MLEISLTFDTPGLLRCIEEYEEISKYLGSQDGLRDSLVRQYCIAADALAGATPVLLPNETNLAILLDDVQSDQQDVIAFFRSCIALIEPLARLQPQAE